MSVAIIPVIAIIIVTVLIPLGLRKHLWEAGCERRSWVRFCVCGVSSIVEWLQSVIAHRSMGSQEIAKTYRSLVLETVILLNSCNLHSCLPDYLFVWKGSVLIKQTLFEWELACLGRGCSPRGHGVDNPVPEEQFVFKKIRFQIWSFIYKDRSI